MNNLKKIHVYLCAVLGILINLIYAGLFFMEIITGDFSIIENQVFISALSLEISWVFLFIWFILRPCKRRDILIISLIPMITANFLNTIFSDSSFWLNTFILCVCCIVFITGYVFAGEMKIVQSGYKKEK